MNSHRDGSHPLASWARKPLVCTGTVIVLGAACIALSLAMPLGIGFLALAILGTTAVVAGVVTLAVLLFGRLLGLRRRSEAAIENGRERILLPGPRPPAMHVQLPGGPRDSGESDQAGDPDEAEESGTVDLRSGDRQSTAA